MKEITIMISVIVPVYNSERYLSTCLESILGQTYKDLQVIAVDDGSSDGSGKILDEYCQKDSRLEVYHQENQGVSAARNLGLRHVKGEYVTFVDSDDTLEVDLYEILLKYADEYQVSIAHCGYNKVTPEGIKPVCGTEKIYVQNNEEALSYLIGGGLFVGSLWNKLYKAALFEGVKFDETIQINEDLLVNYLLFKQVNKSVFVDVTKYNYWERENSSCSRTDCIKKAEDCVRVAEYMYFDINSINVNRVARNRYLNQLLFCYRSYAYCKMPKYKTECKKIEKQIWNEVQKEKIRNRKININAKFIHYMPLIYKYLYVIYDKIRKPNWDV